MIAGQWARIKEIVGEALERAPDQRPAYLDAACSHDLQLRVEVDSLLAAYEEARPLSQSLWAASDAAEQTIESVGPYRLDRELGTGGMGSVWLAEQTEPVHRWVALKLIKPGMYDAAVAQRFRAERQSLAQMDHPAIAKVFDAGTTAFGQPYFVMEFVDGLPITEYCDRKRLNITERLNLFRLVCEGVQHAHQKAVIHRDLKPSNILVVEIDGKAVPRIIDFGLAKAVPGVIVSDRPATQIGAFLGTPGYMSPEQADPGLLDVDTRADVFSLGVILYELLTGYLPFDIGRWKTDGLEAFLRELRETDPRRPSARMSSPHDEAKSRAQDRHTEVRQLTAVLNGDLDWVTMRALEKDRERRYVSPAEFAADIERYLEHHPVRARPASAAYRWSKYLRRHRVGAMGAAVAVLLSIGFVVNQGVQLRRIKRERDRADRIAQFTTGIFTVADPSEARGKNITARELLDKAEHNIDVELRDDPVLQAQMLKVIATVYQRLGLYDKAIGLFQRAIDLDGKILGPNDPETLSATAYYAHCLAQAGRLKEAGEADSKLLPAAIEALGKDNKTTLQVQSDLAWTLEAEGHIPASEALARDALAAQTRTLGEGDRDTLETARSLAWDLAEEGKYAEAEKLDRSTIEISRRTLGPDDPKTLIVMDALGSVLEQESRFAEAEPLLREALKEQQRILGPDHQNVATTMNTLGIALQHEKKYDEAEASFRGAMEVLSKALGPENPSTLMARVNIATVRDDAGDYKEAEEQYKEVLKIQLRTLGKYHQHVFVSIYNIADVYRKEKRYADSIAEFQEDVAVGRKVLGPRNPSTLDAVYGLASVYNLDGQRDTALRTLQEAVDAGYSDTETIEKDESMKPLSANPQFLKIVEQTKHNAAAGAQH